MCQNQFHNKNEFHKYVLDNNYKKINRISEQELVTLRQEVAKAYKTASVKNPHDEYLQKEAERLINNQSLILSQEPMYSKAIDDIYTEIFDALPNKSQEILDKYVTVSASTNPSFEAAIHMSPCNKYFSIILNSALVDFFHKIGKIRQAIVEPESVVYYSLKPGEQVKSNEMIILEQAFIDYFAQFKKCEGPLIRLNFEANYQHIISLRIIEIFIVGHEIGHLMNGDFHNNRFSDRILSNIPNESFRSEHMADIIGFSILLQTLENKKSLNNEQRIFVLLTIMTIFDTIDLMYPELNLTNSTTHPHPRFRIFMISDYFFGHNFTDMLAESYRDLNILSPQIFNFSDIVSNEKLITDHSTAWFYGLFM